MRIDEHKMGELAHETKHRFFYHMTDSHGFAYSIQENALRALRQSHVSVTWDKGMNSVYGYYHSNFKFVLRAPALMRAYGGYSFDHMIRVGDRYKSLKEREMRINTNEIAPLSEFLYGTVYIHNIFSQKFIQDLFYEHGDSRGFFDAKKSAAPRGIEALYRHMVEWKKPLWVGSQHRRPTAQELKFLADAFAIHESGGSFHDGLGKLSDLYPVIGHWNEHLDSTMVKRRLYKNKIVDAYNGYFMKRRVNDVEPDDVRRLLRNALDVLELNSNIQTTVFGVCEELGLFHPAVAAVDWGMIIKPLADGDVEESIRSAKYVAEKTEWQRERHDRSNGDNNYIHAGTSF